MSINFVIRGRLGNAIYRYMASAILCINTNKEYSSGHNNGYNPNPNIHLSDDNFLEISQYLSENKSINLDSKNLMMSGFYQHDSIYKMFRTEIFNYINSNKNHLIITDGVNAGDGNNETFKMYDILNTPTNFNKKYNIVLHLRLEDFVTHNLYLPVDRIITLLNKIIITDNISDNICIVCKKTTTDFEENYIKSILHFLNEKNIDIMIENNDVITDYYIMKEAEILVCSKSTLSWAAAFLSDKNKVCYFPDYTITGSNQTCKSPTTNTILY